MSESKVEPSETDSRSGPDIVYDLLTRENIDSLAALKGALKFFVASEGQYPEEIKITLVRFANDTVTIRAEIV
jgi:hypothetical protein